MKIDELGALFHAEWKAGSKPDEIEGYWTEDNSRYTITIPEQLRDLLLAAQNSIARKYHAMDIHSSTAGNMASELREVLEQE